MADANDLDVRLARIRDATRSIEPPPGLVIRIERLVGAPGRKSPTGWLILQRARPALLASAGLVAAALLVAWRAEVRYDAAVSRAVVAMEVGP